MAYDRIVYADQDVLAYEFRPRRVIYRRELLLVARANGAVEHVSWALGGWETPPGCADLAERLGGHCGRLDEFELALPDLASEYLRLLPDDCPEKFRRRVAGEVEKLGAGWL